MTDLQDACSNEKDESSETEYQLRIRNVCEINTDKSIETELNTNENRALVKRKLPDWLTNKTTDVTSNGEDTLQSETEDGSNTKRSKCSENGQDNEIITKTADIPVKVKSEPVDENQPNTSKVTPETRNGVQPTVAQVKNEPLVKVESPSNNNEDTSDIKPAVGNDTNNASLSNVVQSPSNNNENTSDVNPAVGNDINNASPSNAVGRPSCRFGIRCYRANPMHRAQEAHPGDADYRRPDYPQPPKGTPDCPFGSGCYRRNPVHFQQFTHPPNTNFAQNYINNQLRLRQPRQQNVNMYMADSDDEYDLNDPFINDESEDEYIPSVDEDEGVETDIADEDSD